MKLRKLSPPFFWRYLAQRAFHRAHPEAPLIVLIDGRMAGAACRGRSTS
jgi:hypothetical protein